MAVNDHPSNQLIPRVIFSVLFWAAFAMALNQIWRFELIPRQWFLPDPLPYEYRFVEQMAR